MTRGMAVLLLIAALLGVGELSGTTQSLIDGAGHLGISAADRLQEEVGGMLTSHSDAIDEATAEIDALDGSAPTAIPAP